MTRWGLIEEELDPNEDDGMDENVAIALGLARAYASAV